MTTDALLVSTWNLWEFMRRDGPDDLARHETVAARIAADRPDTPMILLVQELSGNRETETVTQLHTLAEMTGMRCRTGHSETTHSYHGAHWSQLGILWRPGRITPIPGSRLVPREGDPENWLFVSFIVDGCELQAGTTHFSPFARDGRPDAVRRFAAAARVARRPTWTGFDLNASPAYRNPDGAFYDESVLDGKPWQPAFADQAWRVRTPEGWECVVDRAAGEAMIEAGMHDIAPSLGMPWQSTAGDGPHAGELVVPRRIDVLAAHSDAALAATTGYQVDDAPGTENLSDHKRVTAVVDPRRLRAA
ncbi:hypothetical protein [Catenuloplanes japonicus]|uniref:hypothetical protein n=1 Tax=Catenuloplanes japonicus TaxID=33876 RepID=UPI000526783D|nr:hypothetical protein [Catenuloplanes japonicus]